jgi:tripartite-type tricarboxylate transporter receptor subunit TctC
MTGVMPESATGGYYASMPAKPVLVGFIAAAGFAVAAGSLAQSQGFPGRPVRIVVPSPAGGNADDVMRLLDGRLTELTGQSIVIDNRPGVSGNLGADKVARAAPDGYTLLAASLPLVVNPALFGRLNHDVMRDFAPVSLLVAAPFVMVAHPGLPASTVKDFVAYARLRPGELNYASGGGGTNAHVAAELFRHLAKIEIVHVTYKSGGLALAALLGGETQFGIIGVMSAAQYVNTRRLRALGVTGAKRSPLLASVPTVAESGLPGYEFTSWYGVLAPRATPEVRVVALNGHLRNALLAPEVAERFDKMGAEIIASSPDEFGRYLRADLAKWATVVRKTGLRID